jgi:hypothetical protein
MLAISAVGPARCYERESISPQTRARKKCCSPQHRLQWLAICKRCNRCRGHLASRGAVRAAEMTRVRAVRGFGAGTSALMSSNWLNAELAQKLPQSGYMTSTETSLRHPRPLGSRDGVRPSVRGRCPSARCSAGEPSPRSIRRLTKDRRGRREDATADARAGQPLAQPTPSPQHPSTKCQCSAPSPPPRRGRPAAPRATRTGPRQPGRRACAPTTSGSSPCLELGMPNRSPRSKMLYHRPRRTLVCQQRRR